MAQCPTLRSHIHLGHSPFISFSFPISRTARALISRVIRLFFLSLPFSLFLLVCFFVSIPSYDYNNALRREAAGITRSSSYCIFMVAFANDRREMETGGLSMGGQRLKRGWRGDGIAS